MFPGALRERGRNPFGTLCSRGSRFSRIDIRGEGLPPETYLYLAYHGVTECLLKPLGVLSLALRAPAPLHRM